jgi:hypothetical protein
LYDELHVDGVPVQLEEEVVIHIPEQWRYHMPVIGEVEAAGAVLPKDATRRRRPRP